MIIEINGEIIDLSAILKIKKIGECPGYGQIRFYLKSDPTQFIEVRYDNSDGNKRDYEFGRIREILKPSIIS